MKKKKLLRIKKLYLKQTTNYTILFITLYKMYNKKNYYIYKKLLAYHGKN